MAHTLEHDPIGNGHLVVVTGELDIAATPELSTVLLMAAELARVDGGARPRRRGLHRLHRARDDPQGGRRDRVGAGKRLRVVCAGGPVRRLLEMTNLTNRFQLCPTRDDALSGV